MARTKAYIRTTLTHSRKWRAIKNNDRARLLYLQFHHTPVGNCVGCYGITLAHLAADLCWGEQQVQESIDTLSQVGLIDWNPDQELVRIVDFVKHDPPMNDKHAYAMANTALTIPDCVQKLRVFKDLAATKFGAKVDFVREGIDTLSHAFPDPPAQLAVTLTPSLTLTLTQNPTLTPTPSSVSAEPQAATTPAVKASPSRAVVVHEEPFIRLPTNKFGTEGEEVAITQAEVDDYGVTYPAVDVPQELREMRKWLETNVGKRKTAGGMRKFVNSWLAREQDRGGHRLSLNGSGSHGAARTESSVNAARNVLEERHGAGKTH